jgi:uncharacterized protein YbjT (DUF2867 family)
VARCLIVGCGCRGRALTRELRRAGNVVRGTSRSVEALAEIERAGASPFLADPDRLSTLFPALDHVTVAYLLLGSATGDPEQIRALHSERLESLLFKMIDTTIRVVVYEAAGSVDDRILAEGAATVERACRASRMLFSILDADPAQPDAWVRAALSATEAALAG